MGEAIGHATPTARKTHRCYWCGETIEVGEQYTSWVWIDAGSAEKLKCHNECASAWQGAAQDHGEPYETGPAEHSRGCYCEAGRCRCEPVAVASGQ